MPIRRKEAELYPDDLFNSLADESWRIAHVRSRQEKLLARLLHQEGIPFYLPQVEHRVRRNDRDVVSFLPLFPGYVFIRSLHRAERLVRSNSIVRFIDVDDQEKLTMELRQIRSLQEAGASLTAGPPALVSGDAVTIRDGVFRDYFGRVLREKGTLRLVVSVSILNRAVVVEFPRDLLTPLARAGFRSLA
jgi:transcription antitermination factor NusG